MRAYAKSLKTEWVLFVRSIFGFVFTFIFPLVMLVLFGSIYGNEPSAMFGGRGAMDVTVPSYLAMVVGVNGLMTLPLTLAEYKQGGVYKRFDATPAGKGVVIAAQVTVFLATTLAGCLLLIGGGIALYGIHIDGNFLAIAAALQLSAACLFSLGFFITAISRDAKITNLICYFLYFIMLFASGASFPSELFPETMRTAAKVLPMTHVVDLMKGTFAGQPFSDLWTPVVVLAAFTLVFAGAGALLYRGKRW